MLVAIQGGDVLKSPDAHRERTPPPLPVTPLTAADVYVAPVPYSFLQTVSDHLGNLGTSTDGFDAALSAPWNAVDADAASIDSLLTHAQDADFVDGGFNAGYTDPIALDIKSFNATGDVINGSLGGSVVVPTPPDVQPVVVTPGFIGGSGSGLPDDSHVPDWKVYHDDFFLG